MLISTTMVLLTLRSASSLARVAWKPKATLSGRLEGLLQAPAEKDDPAAAQRLAQWLSDKRHVVVLTGAGLSTDSGIPDYRGKAGSYRLGHVPIGHDEFMRNESSRRRYWARALVGYPAFAAAKPNDAHFAVAALEEAGVVSQVITQNVDGLHEAAGSRNVIPLHGRGYRVQCMSCGAESCRGEYHSLLASRNPDYAGVIGERGSERVLDNVDAMPGADWFPDAKLNFAENLLRRADDKLAFIFQGEDQVRREITYAELNTMVSRLAQALKAAGIGPGDRVGGYLPNMPETIAAITRWVTLSGEE